MQQRAREPVGGAPPPATVVPDVNVNLFTVDYPEQFPLAEATPHSAASQLVVTGTVNPDIARSVPLISLATGRVVAQEEWRRLLNIRGTRCRTGDRRSSHRDSQTFMESLCLFHYFFASFLT